MNLSSSKKFWQTIGAFVLSSLVAACGTEAPTSSASPSAVAQNGMSPNSAGTMSPGQMDHSKMDHGKMDHSTMNHGGMNHAMDLGPADASYDLRFIDAMIPHHQGAVVMAQDVLKKSQRPELQKLAKTIISAQEKEIAQMQQWRKAWYPNAAATPMAWHSEQKMMMAMKPEQIQAMKMDMDLGSADAQYDLRFLQAMVPHHEAAVVMAKDLAQKTKRPELQKLAKEIVSSQQMEINQMQQWQKSWYKQ
jgi:uncharacterized protein (DUF305 family)